MISTLKIEKINLNSYFILIECGMCLRNAHSVCLQHNVHKTKNKPNYFLIRLFQLISVDVLKITATN